jgi:hypothetical protein
MQERRRLPDFVLSNSAWKNGKLILQYRKPFAYHARKWSTKFEFVGGLAKRA